MEIKELNGFEICNESEYIDAWESDRAELSIEIGQEQIITHFRRTETINFCVKCKKEFKSRNNEHYEESLCDDCKLDAVEKEGEQ